MKYKIGDRFEGEITSIDPTGMGVIYVLNNELQMSEKHLDILDMIPLSEEKPQQKKVEEHTPEVLKDRILELSRMLTSAIETYLQATGQIESAISAIDGALED